MDNVKHTRGPWRVSDEHPDNACLYVRDEDGREIAVLYTGCDDYVGRDEHGMWGAQPIRDANARLIAAAPGYDEVARDALPILAAILDEREENNGEEDEVLRDLIERLAAAISKATGGAS
jgi:hypothetical protein